MFDISDFWAARSYKLLAPSDLKYSLLFSVGSHGVIHMRGYRSVSFESGTQESSKFYCIGPNVDLEVRRMQAPELRTFQRACKKTRKIHEPKRVKNVNFDGIGAKMGTVHMEKQDFKKLKTSRPKALKRKFMSQDRQRKNLL
ncbi:hypothetical protein MXB_2772 [Myxobolus squamalis]|nr:hypothetical protein MXB_2772 [Myxobolus squamalis]